MTESNSLPTSSAPDASKKVVLHTRVVTGTGGGPEKTILNSPRFMVDSPYDVKIAYLHPPDDPGFEELQRRARIAETSLISVPDRGIRDVGVFRRMLKLCRELNVEIWHGHDYKTNVLGVALRRFHKMKLITTVHGWVRHTKRTPIYYWMDRVSLRYYDRVICVSDDLRERSIESGVKESRCSVIENAIDIDGYRSQLSKSEARSELGLSPDAVIIGGMGRLSPEKGFDELIGAVAALHASGHKVQLVIAGEGDDYDKLAEMCAQQAMPECFQLLGFIKEPAKFFEAIDVFVLSSHREGLPNVLLEAMCCKVPIVSTRVAGAPSLLAEGELGDLVEPGDVTAISECISSVVNNRAAAAERADRAFEVLTKKHSFRRRMERMSREYGDIL